jgi:hypothetical protein
VSGLFITTLPFRMACWRVTTATSAKVARRRAVELHVAARALGIELGRREHADRRLELGGQRELRELLQARADPAPE